MNPTSQTLLDPPGGGDFKSWSDNLTSSGGPVFGTLTSNNGGTTLNGNITNVASSLLGPSKGIFFVTIN